MSTYRERPPCPTCEYCEEHPNVPECKPGMQIDTYLPLLMLVGIFFVFNKFKKKLIK